MRTPPIIDMTIAGTRIISEWASTAGSATQKYPLVHYSNYPNPNSSLLNSHRCLCQFLREWNKSHTNPHNNQKSGTELPKIHYGVGSPAIAEIIGVGASSADPVGEGGEDVGCYDEEGEVLLEEGAGEDYEEEAYC